MKNLKILIMLSLLTLGITSVLAQEKEEAYVIKEIVGKVQFENKLGKWQTVTEETVLFPSTKISTGLNSSITFELLDGTFLTIKAMKKDVIETLLASLTAGGSGITIGAKVTESNINSDTTKGRTNISTASTRASTAVEDIEWVDAEE